MSIPYATPGKRPRSAAGLNSPPRNARSRSAVRGIRKSQGSPRRPSPPYGITPTNMERAAPHGKERRARVAPRVARARQAQGLQESNQRVMKRLQGSVNVRRSHSPEVAHARPAAPHVSLSRHPPVAPRLAGGRGPGGAVVPPLLPPHPGPPLPEPDHPARRPARPAHHPARPRPSAARRGPGGRARPPGPTESAPVYAPSLL